MKKISCTFSPLPINYEIEIQSGLFNDLRTIVPVIRNLGSKVALITDQKLASLYGKALQKTLIEYDLETHLYVFEEGEIHKSRQTKDKIEDQMFAKGLGRDTCVIALGGGVVLDLAGYIASTYSRGVPLVTIPTSLLAMVDACLGGKTGINVPFGKNLIGSIYQPKKVYIDPKMLDTLPLNELRNGIVEMIKHGAIADLPFFEFLEKHADALLALNSEIVDQAIHYSCCIKKQIVEEDEREIGKRRILNFGHTIGHALEKLHGFELPHGEAIALGMLIEGYLAVQLGYLHENELERIRKILQIYGIPLTLRMPLNVKDILEAMILDKKSINGSPRFVIINRIGSVMDFENRYCISIESSLIEKALNWLIHDLRCD